MKPFYAILTLWLCSLVFEGNAQLPSDFNKVVPPTPEAAALQKSAKIPVDYSTGVPNITVPLFEIKSGGLSVPVSINYHASGIQVDQISTSVGLGWSLAAGGAVIRSIRGQADFPNITRVTQHFADSLNDHVYTEQDYIKGNDFTQDDYTYNFLDHTGSFYFDSTGTVREIYRNGLQFQSVLDSPSYFVANDYNGNIYTFQQTDYSIMQTWSTNNPNMNPAIQGNSAWRLTKVTNQQLAQLNLNYENYYSNYQLLTTDVYDVRKAFYDFPPGSGDPCSDNYSTTMYQMMAQHGCYGSLVKQIVGSNARADFYYSTDPTVSYWQRELDSITVTSLSDSLVKTRIYFTYGKFGGNSQLKLLAVKMKNVENGTSEETRFDYYESSTYPLPAIGSRSRDMHGFFNGHTNQFLITSTDPDYIFTNADRSTNPSTIFLGSLKRVMYPSGGSTFFSYEPNKQSTNTYGPGIRIKEMDDYNPVDGSVVRTTYEYYGFGGLTYTYPVNMAAEIRRASYNRKIWSSAGSSYSQLTGITPIIPNGYMYDSVVVRKKGGQYDLLDSYRYQGVSILNSLKAYLKLTSHYKYDLGSNSYQIVQQQKVDYDQLTFSNHNTPLVMALPVTLTLFTSYPDGTVHDCDNFCPGLGSGIILNENAIVKKAESNLAYDGSKVISSTTRYYYGNTDHLLPTRIVKMTSKDSIITTIKYPAEMVAAGLDPTGIYQEMVNRYMLGQKGIEEATDAQGNSLAKKVHTYKDNWLPVYPPFIAPESDQEGYKGATPETRRQVYGYDLYGNIVEYAEDGLHTSLVWDYNGSVPVARAKGAAITEIAYTGFEGSSSGGWQLNGGLKSWSNSLAGRKSYILGSGNTITKSSSSGKDYTVSYWTAPGAAITVNGGSGANGITKNGWTYHEHSLNAPTLITVAGAGTIDELRAYPKGSLMSTYSYGSLDQATDVADPADRFVHFQYNGMQRLSGVLDADRAYNKTIEYHYAQEVPVGTIYYNSAQTGTYYSKTCGVNSIAQPYSYTVPAGLYSSTVSQAVADAAAQREMNAVGQSFANSFGICVP